MDLRNLPFVALCGGTKSVVLAISLIAVVVLLTSLTFCSLETKIDLQPVLVEDSQLTCWMDENKNVKCQGDNSVRPPAALTPSPGPSPSSQPQPEAPAPEAGVNTTGCAYITFASGNGPARHTIALVQSLRDTNTRAEIVVLLFRGGLGSPECQNETWKAEHNRTHIHCGSPYTIAEEIISPIYVETLRRLNATIRVMDQIPRTNYTEQIAGGTQLFWGMALNKMLIFNMTEYRKLIWLDGDTLVFKNIDHLFEAPDFTAAITWDCCNRNAPGRPSGGLWVFAPKLEYGIGLWNLMYTGKIDHDNDGNIKYDPTTKEPVRVPWLWGDMELVTAYFGTDSKNWNLLWPRINDFNHGLVEGLRSYPRYRYYTDEQYEQLATINGVRIKEGYLGPNGRTTPHWHALGASYDQLVGSCDCNPGLLSDDAHSVHFSCFQNELMKPGGYESEKHFMEEIRDFGTSCIRKMFLRWYVYYKKATGGLPEPKYEGSPVPGDDLEWDTFVLQNRKDKGRNRRALDRSSYQCN